MLHKRLIVNCSLFDFVIPLGRATKIMRSLENQAKSNPDISKGPFFNNFSSKDKTKMAQE